MGYRQFQLLKHGFNVLERAQQPCGLLAARVAGADASAKEPALSIPGLCCLSRNSKHQLEFTHRRNLRGDDDAWKGAEFTRTGALLVCCLRLGQFGQPPVEWLLRKSGFHAGYWSVLQAVDPVFILA